MTDITAVVTAHHEGVMAGASMRSLLEAAEHARKAGYETEVFVVLDDANDATRRALCSPERNVRTEEVCFRDQGKTRNFAVAKSTGRMVAFLDADDLWSYNWLTEAATLCVDDRTVVHPEFNCFFGASNNILVKIDDQTPYFDPEFLRVGNYWDALCLAARDLFLAHPYCDRDIRAGFAYEDWHWNSTTIEHGIRHSIARNTIHFKRRRDGSQGSFSTARKAMVNPTQSSRYGWYRRNSGPV